MNTCRNEGFQLRDESTTVPTSIRPLTAWFTCNVESYQLTDILSEDKAICERVPRRIDDNFQPGQQFPIERVVMDFGHFLNWRIYDLQPPPGACGTENVKNNPVSARKSST